MRFIYIFIIAFFSVFACNKTPINQDFILKNPGIYISNEGNFTYGNSSLSYIDLEKDTIFNNIFLKTTSFPLGDVAQSITTLDSNIFVVINNSGKIYVINRKTAKYVATITGLTSPRYIQIISSQKAYVSDLYSNNITIFNPTNFKKIGIININCSSETMLKYNEFVFVTNWNKGGKLIKINSNTDKVEQKIDVTFQPNSLVLDKNNNIWVLSDGGQNVDTTKNDFPALTCINTDNMEIVKTLIFNNKKASPSHLCINSSKDSLFFIYNSLNDDLSNGGVYKLSINSEQIPNIAFISQKNRMFYSMAVNSKSEIIVSDAIDFVQQGIILFYSSSGELKQSYKAGIIPGCFLFNE